MRDPAIRLILRRTELSKYISDPNSKVVDELILPVAKARIDMAVINGYLHGYEIKSASDNLQRLPSQLIAYSKVFDYLTIVTEFKYHDRILSIIPDWVGLSICSDKKGVPEFEVIRPYKLNPDTNKDGFYIAKLLRKEELLELLSEENIPHKKHDRVWSLCAILSKNIEVSLLSGLVREKLKKRSGWKIIEDQLCE